MRDRQDCHHSRAGPKGEEFFELVIDRINLGRFEPERVLDSAEQAFAIGGGRLRLHLPDGTVSHFSRGRHCSRCDRGFVAPSPHFFSFNAPTGACPRCQGFGRILAIDWDLVIPDKGRSLREGAIRPLENWEDEKDDLLEWCWEQDVSPDLPWRDRLIALVA